MLRKFSLVALLAFAVLASGVSAQTSFFFTLDGSQENPAVTTTALGVGFATLDAQNNFTVRIQHNVSNATAMHIHMAPSGSNGGVAFPFSSAAQDITQTFVLSAAQATTAATDGFYVNIHSSANPGGEIRGQITNGFQSSVFINEYCNDPFGSIGLDTNLDLVPATSSAQQEDEFVEIVNGTDAPVALDNWEVLDAASGGTVRHTFAAGTILPPGAAIVVFGGGDVTNFNAAGFAGVAASTGQLGFNNTNDTVELRDNNGLTIDIYSYSSGSIDDGDGESVTRDNGTVLGNMVQHTTLPAGLSHSAGLFNDGVFPYPAAILPAPVTVTYPGNGTDAAVDIFIDGTPDSPGTKVHNISAGQILGIGWDSPNGTLDGTPFLSIIQLFNTGTPPTPTTLAGDPAPSVFYSVLLPTTVLADGLSNPGALVLPRMSFYSISAEIPAFLGSNGRSLMLQTFTMDASLPSGFGATDAREFIVQ